MGRWVGWLRGEPCCLAGLVLLAMGCGARSATLTGEEQIAGGEPGEWTGRSYELKFDRFVDPSTGATSSLLPGGDRARLDLELLGDKPRAVVTPYAGDPNSFVVEKEQGRWVLTGQLLGIELLSFRGFEYDRIELPFNAAGSPILGGTVVAHGRAYNSSSQSDDPSLLEGGVDFEASGTLVLDELSPALNARGPLRRSDRELLPWDAVTVTSTEPVDLQMLTSGANVEAGGQELQGTWSGWPSEAGRGAAGVTQALFVVDDFPALALAIQQAGARPMAASLEAPGSDVLDPSGNPGRGGTRLDFEFMRVGPAVSRYTFDDVAALALWNAQWYYGVGARTCASEGCVAFYPQESLNDCTEQGMGLLLAIEGQVSAFSIAFRASATKQLPLDQTLLTVEAVAPRNAPSVFQIPMPELRLAADGWQYQSELQVASVPLPPGATQGAVIGVSIQPGPPRRCTLDWADVLTSITIEEVSVGP